MPMTTKGDVLYNEVVGGALRSEGVCDVQEAAELTLQLHQKIGHGLATGILVHADLSSGGCIGRNQKAP